MGEELKINKKIENEEWVELYEYVKNDILKYEKHMKLPTWFILRLKGLRNGKFVANKNTKPLGDYTFKIILMTFKINKFEIIRAISNNSKFKDERHRINYLMAIVESRINDTYMRLNKLKKSEENGENVKINISEDKAEYKKKTKEVKNNRLKGLI